MSNVRTIIFLGFTYMCVHVYTHTHTHTHIHTHKHTSDQILCSVTRMTFMCPTFDRIGAPWRVIC